MLIFLVKHKCLSDFGEGSVKAGGVSMGMGKSCHDYVV